MYVFCMKKGNENFQLFKTVTIPYWEDRVSTASTPTRFEVLARRSRRGRSYGTGPPDLCGPRAVARGPIPVLPSRGTRGTPTQDATELKLNDPDQVTFYRRICLYFFYLWWNFKLNDGKRGKRPTIEKHNRVSRMPKWIWIFFGTKFAKAVFRLKNMFENRWFPPENRQNNQSFMNANGMVIEVSLKPLMT